MSSQVTQGRSLPLRERKKLRTRRALADAALRLFTEKGVDATTLEELADAAEVSKSTFSRTFPAKEAAGIEAEAELWSAYLAALEKRALTGTVLARLHHMLTATVIDLDRDWDKRFLATRRLIAAEPALLRYTEHHRAQVKEQIAATLAARLGLDAEDLRPHILAELVMTAWSMSGRAWVRRGGEGGRAALLEGFADAIGAVPASLTLTAPGADEDEAD